MTLSKIYDWAIHKKIQKQKILAVLLDPDKIEWENMPKIIQLFKENKPDILLVGGSLLTNNQLEACVFFLKKNIDLPILLFPSSFSHLSQQADGVLFLSLISGRNADYLIGNHVLAAPLLKQMSLEILPTGYMLIDCGQTTTAAYMSGTFPMPYHKDDIAVCTALAGEMLGLKMLYLDGGSGADKPVSESMIRKVQKNTTIPLIVGGGIRNPQQLQKAYQAGADWVVIGTIIEQNPQILKEMIEIRNAFLDKN